MSQAGGISSSGGGGGGTAVSGTATSTNGSTEDLITIDLGAVGAVYRFYFMITGRDTATDDGLGYHILASAKTNGAAATLIQTEFIDADEEASLLTADIALVPSGNFVILQVTGVVGQNITYSAIGNYIFV